MVSVKVGSKIRQLMSVFFLLAFIWVVEPLLLGTFAGWLSLRAEGSVHYWVEHPWRVFWLTFPLVLIGWVLGIFGFEAVGHSLIGISGALSLLSAIQGIRSVWHRSHQRAILIVSVVWGLSIIKGVIEASNQPDYLPAQVINLLGGLLSGPIWILAALVAEYASSRLSGREEYSPSM